MKVLIVSREERSRSLTTLFDGVAGRFETTLVKLTKQQIRDFSSTVERLNCDDYDRVLFDVPLRRMGKHYRSLKAIAGLVLYEEDTCQELIPKSQYYRRYAKIYKKIGACKLIVTSFYMRDVFSRQGLDVVVIPKAYDDALLYSTGCQRDIELGFIGRIKNKVYRERSRFLQRINDGFDLTLLRTESDAEYLQSLNRIKIFVSADIGFEEYMAKNFEAMACGCMLLAQRQTQEEASLGLVDGVNVVLYANAAEAELKLGELLQDFDRVSRIAQAGCELVRSRHGLSHRVADFCEAIEAEVAAYSGSGLWGRLFG